MASGPSSWRNRIAWLLAIWAMSVTALFLLAGVLRMWLTES